MEKQNKEKFSFFLDLFKKKIWAILKITTSKKNKQEEIFFLNFKSFYNKILKIKVKNSNRNIYKFLKKNSLESIDILRNKSKNFNLHFLEEEIEREKFLKKKGKNFILFLKESDFLSKTVKPDLYYKNIKILKSKKIEISKKKTQGKFQFIFLIPFQKNLCFLRFFFSKIMLFPKKYTFDTKKKNFFNFFFYKVSILVLYSIERFGNFKNLARLYPLRAIIIKNKFFFLIFFFLEKNSIKTFGNLKNFYNFFFFLSQYLKQPIDSLVFSFFYLEKTKNFSSKIKESDFFQSLLKPTIKYFIDNFPRKSNFYCRMVLCFSIFLLKLFSQMIKQEKFLIKVDSKNENLFFNILGQKHGFSRKIVELFLKNFDFLELRAAFFQKPKRKNRCKKFFNFFLKKKKIYFFIVKPFLKSFFSVKKKTVQIFLRSEKKKTRIELALKSNSSGFGFFLPVHVLKSNNLCLVFWVPIRFNYHFFEISWGTKKSNLVRYEPHFLPSFLLKSFLFKIEIFQEINIWINFLKIFKNRIFGNLFLPLGFLNFFNQKKKFNRTKEEEKPLHQFFFFELLFLLEETYFFLAQILFLLRKREILSNNIKRKIRMFY
ncbi:hypothetical protein HAN_3g456 (nucleomorph) [Hemiselmis andersenii]|uniref:Uncharacterized protein n=1 Tax=Hemiselmis andersenii TaxID=464988 RepID=A9BL75_HEMAN|nr:hypothetical protein HAN_3g456 [Hemiselmis andersenii]ABW98258.1 hypothetical protein HAN_3g456 [Hemiselmis andersenii]